MSKPNLNNLTPTDALILQQIAETGEETLTELMYDTGMSQGMLHSLLCHLKKKGLVVLNYSYEAIYVSLSKQGRRAMHEVWPSLRYA